MPATAVADPEWLGAQLALAARRFRVDARTAGVLWWYSAGTVLLGPSSSSYVRGGPVDAPDLDSMTLFVHPDGRLLEARAAGSVSRPEVPARVGGLVEACVRAVAPASGASPRSLWAIASDSLANGVLWAGGGEADAVALAADERFPRPRFVEVAGQLAVRRSSCCLVYESPGQQKCVSCPRQRPDDRLRRLRVAFGG
ncbi:(2Fe-2S)-binding protein [Actinophytocola sp.]|uniref:(2Fe-2S)-binding protein n=1 Tax=Actinophytocola sp. TaxID=1872138 RepID=UPI00389AABC3